MSNVESAPERGRTATGEEPVVTARDACAPLRGRARAFEFASFYALEGEVCALVSAEGATARAVLTAIAGVSPVESGSLSVCGLELASRHAGLLARRPRPPRGSVGLSVVTGGFDIPGTATVGEAVSHELALWRRDGGSGEDVLDYLAEFELACDADRSVGDLSAPSRGRLTAALALACAPRVAAVDLTDPFVLGLTSSEGEELVRLLGRVARARSCAVVAGLTDGRVARAADRLFALDLPSAEALRAADRYVSQEDGDR